MNATNQNLENDQLSDDDLDNVTGGMIVIAIIAKPKSKYSFEDTGTIHKPTSKYSFEDTGTIHKPKSKYSFEDTGTIH
jgi:hypothetical protein